MCCAQDPSAPVSRDSVATYSIDQSFFIMPTSDCKGLNKSNPPTPAPSATPSLSPLHIAAPAMDADTAQHQLWRAAQTNNAALIHALARNTDLDGADPDMVCARVHVC